MRNTFVFLSNATASAVSSSLSLHDALPISAREAVMLVQLFLWPGSRGNFRPVDTNPAATDRKSTRLNSSHANISYAVFCLKKKISYNYNCATQSSSEERSSAISPNG